MSLAHVCSSCGHPLTRVRAVLDPHYHLPLVICPGCASASVRRRHPLSLLRRRALKLHFSLASLYVTIIALSLTLAGSIWAAALMLDLFRALNTDWLRFPADLLSARASAPKLPEWIRGSAEAFSPVLFIIATLLSGVVAGFALTHWRKRSITLAWLIIWQAALLVPLTVMTLDRLLVHALDPQATSPLRLDPSYAAYARNLAVASLYASLPHFLGILCGRAMLPLARYHERRRWIRRRRALKKRRESR